MTRGRVTLRVIRPSAPPAAPRRGHDAAPPDATQRIVDSITAAIAERRLMPGTRLAEQKLADLFRVSRARVRQALHRLSRDRLVLLQPARGASVATPSVAEARQVLEARQLIEGTLIKQLAGSITPAQIAELRMHLHAERAAVGRADVSGRTRLLAEFHVVLARMLGNEVLAQLLRELLARSSLIALMRQSTRSAEAAHAEHVAIVDALECREAGAATRLMRRHLAGVERNLQLDPRRPDLALVLTRR